jgi:hypothetical protein
MTTCTSSFEGKNNYIIEEEENTGRERRGPVLRGVEKTRRTYQERKRGEHDNTENEYTK